MHKAALLRCLVDGVSKSDPRIAEEIAATDHSFDIVSWTYDFYREHRDFSLDAASIDALIAQQGPESEDIREASSLMRSATIWLYRLGDIMPFLIPHLASEKMEVHIRDLQRYVRNINGIAEHAREMLKMPLRAACERQRPILLVAHSMGSVIAYDSLWELTHNPKDRVLIDRLLTLGSPLGQNYLQKRIFGHDKTGTDRYPDNIRRWSNLSSIGELTATDRHLKNDFREMLDLNMVESIEDDDLYNHFRLNGKLNVHAEYGYLASEVTGKVISDWWSNNV